MARIQPIRAVVDELLSEHQINRPSDIDVMRIASSMGIEVRQSQMDGCAANIVGLETSSFLKMSPCSSFPFVFGGLKSHPPLVDGS